MRFLAVLVAFLWVSPAHAMQWQEIVVHHTATAWENVKQFGKRECDAAHRARGWDECGYNFLIQPNGAVESARPLTKPGAHCPGKNRTAIGVAFVMDGRYDKPTEYMGEAFKSLKRQLEGVFGRLKVSFHGDHRATLCPTDAVREVVNG